MARSLSDIVEGIHWTECKCEHDDKKCKTCAKKFKDGESSIEYTSAIENLVEYKCLCWNKNYVY